MAESHAEVNRVKLLDHQKHLQQCEMEFPFYIFWGMGSGKTIAGILCIQKLQPRQKALIVCDKSLLQQWEREVNRMRNQKDFPLPQKIEIVHYEGLDKEGGPIPKKFDMCIVDEAHRFRNAWHTESKRMLSWMRRFHLCPKLVFLSGTPLVHDVDIEMDAFYQMMKSREISKRIHFYDPRQDSRQTKFYAKTQEDIVKCEMSWAQCFVYLLNRKQEFSIQLEGEESVRRRMSSSRNTYNTMLRSIANNPFPENPEWSPKFQKVIENLDKYRRDNTLRQVVYSSRRDTGITALKKLWLQYVKANEVFEVNGSMSELERDDQVMGVLKMPRGVIFITDAGGQGIDFKHIGAMHIVEPSDNLQEERQVINRSVRFKAHRIKDPIVQVYQYVIIFPKHIKVELPWKRELFNSGLFQKHELKGLTERMQKALIEIIQTEENSMTIDEKIQIIRKTRDDKIQASLEYLKSQAYVLPRLIQKPKDHNETVEEEVKEKVEEEVKVEQEKSNEDEKNNETTIT